MIRQTLQSKNNEKKILYHVHRIVRRYCRVHRQVMVPRARARREMAATTRLSEGRNGGIHKDASVQVDTERIEVRQAMAYASKLKEENMRLEADIQHWAQRAAEYRVEWNNASRYADSLITGVGGFSQATWDSPSPPPSRAPDADCA